MKLRKIFFFTLVFAALVFCISCKGKSDKYDEFDDWDTDLNDNDAGDTTEDGSDTDTDSNDTDSDTESDTGTEDKDNEIPDESHENDHDQTSDDDSDTDTVIDDDTDTDTDTNPVVDDDTDTEVTGDEDSIPETEDPAVVCTGQNKCFNNQQETSCPTSPDDGFFGQDAQYANKGYCLLKSFTASSDIVTDNISGLIWQRNLPETYNTCENSIACNYQQAINYCSNLSYAGFSDWRLPTPEEFGTIKDFGSVPAIDTEKFPIPSTTTKTFWTETPVVNSSNRSWIVNFVNGETTSEKNSAAAYVRCVRGEELTKPNFKTFTENEEDIVYDYTNNLKWAKEISDDLTWKGALKYCKNLEYGGETGWRLPNINELASFLDYSHSNPASEFPGLKSNNFWSSTSYTGYPSQAWVINSSDGTVKIYSEKTYTAKVLCVK